MYEFDINLFISAGLSLVLTAVFLAVLHRLKRTKTYVTALAGAVFFLLAGFILHASAGKYIEDRIFRHEVEEYLRSTGNRNYTIVRKYDRGEYERQVVELVAVRKQQKNLTHAELLGLYGKLGSAMTKKYIPFASGDLLLESARNDLELYRYLAANNFPLLLRLLFPAEFPPSFEDIGRLNKLSREFRVNSTTEKIILSGIKKEFTGRLDASLLEVRFKEDFARKFPSDYFNLSRRKQAGDKRYVDSLIKYYEEMLKLPKDDAAAITRYVKSR